MRLFVEHALQMLAAGDPELAASMAKYYCAEQLQEIVAKGMRIMGGRAFFSFEQMSRYYCEAPFSLYAGGTVEIQKNLIAHRRISASAGRCAPPGSARLSHAQNLSLLPQLWFLASIRLSP
jgi:alkylation response protein AidB-like acyl-CoA dehydrogenase